MPRPRRGSAPKSKSYRQHARPNLEIPMKLSPAPGDLWYVGKAGLGSRHQALPFMIQTTVMSCPATNATSGLLTAGATGAQTANHMIKLPYLMESSKIPELEEIQVFRQAPKKPQPRCATSADNRAPIARCTYDSSGSFYSIPYIDRRLVRPRLSSSN